MRIARPFIAGFLSLTSVLLAARANAQPAPTAATTPATMAAPSLLSTPILAGDARTLWLVTPELLESRRAGYSMMEHQLNRQQGQRDLWRQNASRFQGEPKLLAVCGNASNPSASSSAYLFFDDGSLIAYAVDHHQRMTSLPSGQKPMAVFGTPEGLFALTLGTPLNAPSGGDVTQAWNLQVFSDERWNPLTSMSPSSPSAPSPQSQVSLVVAGERLVLGWINPDSPQTLRLRQWPLRSKNPAHDAQVSLPSAWQRLSLCNVDQQVLATGWLNDSQGNWILQVGRLTMAGEMPPPRQWQHTFEGGALPPLVATLGNALVVLTYGPQHQLFLQSFDTSGQRIGPSHQIIPRPIATHPSPLVNILGLLLVTFVLALSLWQRQEMPPLAPHLVLASPTRRLGALSVDLALTWLMTSLVFERLNPEDWLEMAHIWLRGWDASLSDSTLANPLLWLIAFYLLYMILSEWLFGRSLGKWLTGLRVVSLQGQPPSFGAIFIRNVLRSFEIYAWVMIFFIFINPYRQRLGDLLARTVVIQDPPKEEPKEQIKDSAKNSTGNSAKDQPQTPDPSVRELQSDPRVDSVNRRE